jgi:hypothetical protein
LFHIATVMSPYWSANGATISHRPGTKLTQLRPFICPSPPFCLHGVMRHLSRVECRPNSHLGSSGALEFGRCSNSLDLFPLQLKEGKWHAIQNSERPRYPTQRLSVFLLAEVKTSVRTILNRKNATVVTHFCLTHLSNHHVESRLTSH